MISCVTSDIIVTLLCVYLRKHNVWSGTAVSALLLQSSSFSTRSKWIIVRESGWWLRYRNFSRRCFLLYALWGFTTPLPVLAYMKASRAFCFVSSSCHLGLTPITRAGASYVYFFSATGSALQLFFLTLSEKDRKTTLKQVDICMFFTDGEVTRLNAPVVYWRAGVYFITRPYFADKLGLRTDKSV